MPAGELRHRLRFDRDSGTTDATTGTHTVTLTERCTRSVDVLPLASGPFAALRVLYPTAQFAAIARYDSGTTAIVPGDIAAWRGTSRTFDVLGTVDPDGRCRWMHIALQERGVPRVVSP